jgi:hypothetical protein
VPTRDVLACVVATFVVMTGVGAHGGGRATGRGVFSRGQQVIGMHRAPKGIRDNRSSIWNDPSVMRERDRYSMWASKGIGGPKDVAIYKLSSPDGENWQVENDGRPVLEPGGTRDFDSLGVETPMVIKVGDMYHMYYSAYPHGKVPLVTMGHSTSADGLQWKKLGELSSITQPVGTNTGNPWGRLGRGEPAVVHHEGLFYLYFTDVRCRQPDCSGSPAVVRGISLATSRDGHTFVQSGSEPILLQTPSYRASEGWEGYSTPWVFARDGKFELFCDVFRAVGKQSLQTSITHLRSEDGVRFSEVSAHLLTAGGDGWTAVSVRSPSVVVQNGVWRMWYAGDNYDPARNRARGSRLDAGIGVMTLSER